ncbi:MAG: AI-2E family transporter [Planctomycetota bacterium]
MGTVVGFLIVVGLQWGRPVLIPIGLAVLLTILLSPIVQLLQSKGLGRVVSVMVTVSVVGIFLTCLGWMVTRQVTGILAELPQNTATIKAKLVSLRQLGSGPEAERFGQMIEEIQRELMLPAHRDSGAPNVQPARTDTSAEAPSKPEAAEISTVPWLSLTGYLGSALEVLATLAFALVLLVFFLLGREDLRDRLVLLAGKTRLAVTSKAVEDVTVRVSRYIVIVAVVNGGFGVLLTVGLMVLGTPYAVLWGFLAAALRFVPYIGPWIGAVFPIMMSLATSEGWWQPLAVFGYVVALELITNNIVEPLLFGHSTGVSPTALLISAAFWLYLWGPIGLVLSAPFAVCLVVLGKNIPQLNFLNLLLGDGPAFNSQMNVYQRLMVGTQHETDSFVAHHLKGAPAEEVFDSLLIPALNYTRRDVQRDYLTSEDQSSILEGMRASLQQIDSLRRTESADEEHPDVRPLDDENEPLSKRARLLACPAGDDTDRVGLEMLQQLLDPARWEIEVTAPETLTSEIVARVAEDPPDMICIASLPPGGLAQARYLCKRLKSSAPEIPIVVGRWCQTRNSKLDRERLEQAGATFVTTTLLETRKLLVSRLPLLTRQISTTDDAELQESISG